MDFLLFCLNLGFARNRLIFEWATATIKNWNQIKFDKSILMKICLEFAVKGKRRENMVDLAKIYFKFTTYAHITVFFKPLSRQWFVFVLFSLWFEFDSFQFRWIRTNWLSRRRNVMYQRLKCLLKIFVVVAMNNVSIADSKKSL